MNYTTKYIYEIPEINNLINEYVENEKHNEIVEHIKLINKTYFNSTLRDTELNVIHEIKDCVSFSYFVLNIM